MPELPEVETTLQGIAPAITGEKIKSVIVRERRLRWTIPASFEQTLSGNTIDHVSRRAKYLLIHTQNGTLIVHLGMSGSLKIATDSTVLRKHDHVDILFFNGTRLRFHDPRRFGCLLWTKKDPFQHKLLKTLGPEPLTDMFNARYLYTKSRNRKVSIKQFIMNSHIVVGVGNIYASEALFMSGINPKRMASGISLTRYECLNNSIKTVLSEAIKQGGTTLRDFVSGKGEPGYFQQKLNVYAKQGDACSRCNSTIKTIKQGQRSTFYCPNCQT